MQLPHGDPASIEVGRVEIGHGRVSLAMLGPQRLERFRPTEFIVAVQNGEH
jgi:hypothetical protein